MGELLGGVIGLLDADLLDAGTKFPNLALMKLSGYYARRGAKTRLILNYNDALDCDRIFVSKVFTKTALPNWLGCFADVCEFGGTGFDYTKNAFLPNEIERSKPDYQLYKPFVESFEQKPGWLVDYVETSVGFTSRGCFRRCPFCVNRNARASVRWSPVAEFLDADRKYITLLDDNVFACHEWETIFDELQATGKRFAFKQGLDVRLMSRQKAKALARSKYLGDVIFAFDRPQDRAEIERGLDVFRTECAKQAKCYLLVGYYASGAEEIIGLFERIRILRKYDVLPYVMKHEYFKRDPFGKVYVDVARWANQPKFFKKATFRQFGERYGNKETRYFLQKLNERTIM